MGIICFDQDAVIPYVPEYGGNRESDEPTVINLRFIPHSKVQHYSRLILAKTKGLNNDAEKTAKVLSSVQKQQFLESVDSIDNYYVRDAEGNTKEVKDAEGFYQTADNDLIIEVLKAMESQQKLSEGQIKN